jgi:hypothetical protein
MPILGDWITSFEMAVHQSYSICVLLAFALLHTLSFCRHTAIRFLCVEQLLMVDELVQFIEASRFIIKDQRKVGSGFKNY